MGIVLSAHSEAEKLAYEALINAKAELDEAKASSDEESQVDVAVKTEDVQIDSSDDSNKDA